LAEKSPLPYRRLTNHLLPLVVIYSSLKSEIATYILGHIMALQVASALKTSGNETNANPALLQFSVYNYTSILEVKGKGLVKRRWHLRW